MGSFKPMATCLVPTAAAGPSKRRNCKMHGGQKGETRGVGRGVQGSKDYDPVKMKEVVGNKRSKRKCVSADVAGDWSYQRPWVVQPRPACVFIYAFLCVCIEPSTAGLNSHSGHHRCWISQRLSQAAA